VSLPVLDLVEEAIFEDLRAFLVGCVPSGTEIIRTQVNRVAVPKGPNFLTMTPLGRERLATNVVEFHDNVAMATIAADVMTVSEVTYGALAADLIVVDVDGTIPPGTSILEQLSGTDGGAGDYRLSAEVDLSVATAIYAGVRDDLVATELRVQVDAYGPRSSETVTIIEGLFRSDVAADWFDELGSGLSPLYCDPARQAPFIDSERQYGDRWTIDLHLQINPVISTWMQFAERLEVLLVQVDHLG